MELLIMISACKGGSANKITAVLPYFPYSRQSKQKSHRGAITARMLANLLSVAGVHHIVTVDLHAAQMQGFFGRPVDDLHAEPFIARWIRHNVPDWREAVVVSKNAGGTKRVTSLADVLKLNFGIVTMDRRRGNPASSMALDGPNGSTANYHDQGGRVTDRATVASPVGFERTNDVAQVNGSGAGSHAEAGPDGSAPDHGEDSGDDSADGRARNVVRGRLVHGQLVDDDFPSPPNSLSASVTTAAGEIPVEQTPDAMTASMLSSSSRLSGVVDPVALDAGVSSDDDEAEEILESFVSEHMITVVGNVRDKTVFIVDDIIDKPRSWIAAAETVVKRGGARRVYCIATHGLFGSHSLEELAKCDCIDQIVVTNSCPISIEDQRLTKKLVVLDISILLSEAIRRNHYGESLSQLYDQYYE
ncbi:MAG: hypothetical protein M1815_005972 [Lichina confinis]|nr:MAG: hypothetical protein M1815_005972 [Lichina confinis]